MGASAVVRRRVAVLSIVLCAALGAFAPPAHAATATGTTSDGGSWIADVPDAWNGTLLLYSHGYGTTQASDAPDAATKAALLARGYALAGSGMGPPSGSLWVLGTALRDQFETLDQVRRTVLPHRPRRVLALGTSMGGLVSSLEAEAPGRRIDGALSTCGIVYGGVTLSNYQLDGEYAMARLLAPGQAIQLTGYADAAAAAAAAAQLQAVGVAAQATPEGRARLALAMAFLNVTDWDPTAPAPPPADDPDAVQAGQYAAEFGFPAFPIIPFTVTGRQQIELAAGGNPSWTKGVDFAAELERSPYLGVVRALYAKAGLDLAADLATLTRDADVEADRAALAWLRRTSVPTGRLRVPVLTLHTVGDNLVPVTGERLYARRVAKAGASHLLRQAYVQRAIHCSFTPEEIVAGVEALEQRVRSGRWGALPFAPYEPGEMIGTNRRAGVATMHR